MVNDGIIYNLPELVQTGRVRSEITYEFKSGKDVYNIKKGPAINTYEVKSSGTTFTEGTDYQFITDNDGNPVKINWNTGGDNPENGDLFIIDQEYYSVMSRYLSAHDDEFDAYNDDLLDVIQSHQIDNATGDDIDRIGALFGQLGARQGRTDDVYRSFLKSIVDSFSGRGSRSGLKFAIAAAVGGEPSDIQIVENVEELSYTVRITNVDTDFLTSAVNELAELADPSGVELREAIILTGDSEIGVESSPSTATSQTVGLGGNTLTLDGNSTLG